MFWPCEASTSTCRSFATISSGLYRLLAITVLLDVKDIPQVGPLQWGRIRTTANDVSRNNRMAWESEGNCLWNVVRYSCSKLVVWRRIFIGIVWSWRYRAAVRL